MSEYVHEEDCEKFSSYSDRYFSFCKCRARLLNTFAGADYRNSRGERPIKTIVLVANESPTEADTES